MLCRAGPGFVSSARHELPLPGNLNESESAGISQNGPTSRSVWVSSARHDHVLAMSGFQGRDSCGAKKAAGSQPEVQGAG